MWLRVTQLERSRENQERRRPVDGPWRSGGLKRSIWTQYQTETAGKAEYLLHMGTEAQSKRETNE